MFTSKKIKIIAFITAISFSSLVHGENDSNEFKQDEPPAIGNFILPSSQEPATLVGFGRNLIEAGQTQVFLSPDDFIGSNNHYAEIIPFVVHGMSDDTSLFLAVPLATSFQDLTPPSITPGEVDEEGVLSPPTITPASTVHSAGVQDTEVKLEHTLFYHSTRCYVEDAGFVTSITFPTGSEQKEPATGFGQPTLLLGGIYSRTYADWFGFTSDGVRLTMPPAWRKQSDPLTTEEGFRGNNDFQFGNELLYQAGIGRNLFNIGKKWIIAFMVEGDGTYTSKTKENGQTDPNSGGNTIFITPSLWASSKHLILQLGVGFPVVQNLNGFQTKTHYSLIGNVGWTFG